MCDSARDNQSASCVIWWQTDWLFEKRHQYRCCFCSDFIVSLVTCKGGRSERQEVYRRFFMRMAVVCPFIEKENFVHKGIMYDGNVITGIGMFFREFAEAVLQRFGYDISHGPVNIFAQKVDTTQNSQSLYCFFCCMVISVSSGRFSRLTLPITKLDFPVYPRSPTPTS